MAKPTWSREKLKRLVAAYKTDVPLSQLEQELGKSANAITKMARRLGISDRRRAVRRRRSSFFTREHPDRLAFLGQLVWEGYSSYKIADAVSRRYQHKVTPKSVRDAIKRELDPATVDHYEWKWPGTKMHVSPTDLRIAQGVYGNHVVTGYDKESYEQFTLEALQNDIPRETFKQRVQRQMFPTLEMCANEPLQKNGNRKSPLGKAAMKYGVNINSVRAWMNRYPDLAKDMTEDECARTVAENKAARYNKTSEYVCIPLAKFNDILDSIDDEEIAEELVSAAVNYQGE